MTLLANFIRTVEDQNLGVYGIHVYQNDKTLAEHRFRSNDRENLCSASKTFTAVAIGIAVREGLLTVEDHVLDFFPEFNSIAYEGSEHITVEHLLTMTSGHLHQEEDKFNDMDRAQLFFSTELKAKPGTTFFYEDLCSYMLGRIVYKVSGADLLAYLKPRLFDKLGIVNPQWHTCHLGYPSGSGGLYLTTEEFSRVGVLLLSGGVYQGQRILSADYVERMHDRWVDTSVKMDPETQRGYGYKVWKCTLPNAYRADGMYGQFCVILKDYNAVITITGHNEENPKDTLRAVWRDIVPLLVTS